MKKISVWAVVCLLSLSGCGQDPTNFFSYEEFERQFDSGYSNGLAGFIEERAAYLEERLPEIMRDAASGES